MIYGINLRTKEHQLWEEWMGRDGNWQYVRADSSGWITWVAREGATCPLPDHLNADIKLRDGEVVSDVCHWDSAPYPDRRVVAYRPHIALSPSLTWLPWLGGPMPVEHDTLVDVMHRDGTIFYSQRAGAPGGRAHNWHINEDRPCVGDIVAWRPSANAPTKPRERRMLKNRIFKPDMSKGLIDNLLDHMPTEYEAREAVLTLAREMKDVKQRLSHAENRPLRFKLHDNHGPFIRFELMTYNPAPDTQLRIAINNIEALGIGSGNEDLMTFTLPRVPWAAHLVAQVRAICDRIEPTPQSYYSPRELADLPVAPDLYIMPVQTRLSCVFRLDTPLAINIHEVLRVSAMHLFEGRPYRETPLKPSTYVCARTTPLWQIREILRFNSEDYTPLPDSILKRIPREVLEREIPHLAIKGRNVGKVAYTEKEIKGINDVQSVMKPGKYLRRVLAEQVDDKTLKSLVAEMHAHSSFEVCTTNDAEEIAWVYLNGPESCMSHGKGRFDETIDLDGDWRHPMEVFDHPDSPVQLVYVKTQGKVGARALVNTDTGEYPTYYVADWSPHAGTVLVDWLNEYGYTQCDEALYGVPLAKIPLQNGHFLCPYIDHGNPGVEIYSSYLVVDGPYQAAYSDGFVREVERAVCDNCGDHYDEDEQVAIVDNDDDTIAHVCPCCNEDEAVEAWIDGSDYPALIYRRDAIDLGTFGEYRGHNTNWAHDHFSGFSRIGIVICEESGDYIHENDAVMFHDGDGYVDDRYVARSYDPAKVLYSENRGVYQKYILFEGDAYEPEELAYDAENYSLIRRDELDEAEFTTEDNVTYYRIDDDAA